MKSDIKMVFFLLILSNICVALLALGNEAYKDASVIFKVRLYETIMTNYDIPYDAGEETKTFEQNFTEIVKGKTNYYISKIKNRGSVVFASEGPGLWSVVELLITIDKDRKHLLDMTVLGQAETPGLGARITEQWFMDNFKNVEIRPTLKVVSFKSNPNEVDAISGATVTSNAVETIINKGVLKMDKELTEVKQ